MGYERGESSCPRGHGLMDLERRDARTAIQRCRKCMGMWIPGDVVGSYLATPGAAEAILAIEASCDPKIVCPGCRKALKPVFVNSNEVDICPNCRGIWFDAGELAGVKRDLPPDGPSAVGPVAAWETAGLVLQGIEDALLALLGPGGREDLEL